MSANTDSKFLREKVTLLLDYLPHGDSDLTRLLQAIEVMASAVSMRELGYLDAEVDRQASYHRDMTPAFGRTGYRAFYSMLRVKYGRARVRENARVIASRVLKKGLIADDHEARAVRDFLCGDFRGCREPDNDVIQRYQVLLSRYEHKHQS